MIGRYFGYIVQNSIGNLVTRNEKVFSDEADALLKSKTITTHYECRMHGKTNQL